MESEGAKGDGVREGLDNERAVARAERRWASDCFNERFRDFASRVKQIRLKLGVRWV